MTGLCRRCNGCPACEPTTHGHRPGCLMLCPTCLDGTLVELERRLLQEERRRYSCGCPWRSLEARVLVQGGIERFNEEMAASKAEAREVIAAFLEGCRG